MPVRRSKRSLGAGFVAGALLLSSIGALSVAEPVHAGRRVPCDAGALQRAVPRTVEGAVSVTVSSAESVATPFSHCLVKGAVVTQAVSPESQPNQVNWMVALPEGHNGRYYFIGLGGTAGIVPPPPANLLEQGYAVAGTDTGTRVTLDWGFMFDPTVRRDHDNRGGHVSAVVTQALTKAYYGTHKLYRYHSGCSGGGRMGRSAAGLWPADYDGILLGAPGRSVGNVLHFGKVAQYLNFHPDGYIPPATFAAIGATVLREWDDADGALDQMIWDPRLVSYTATELDALLTVHGLTAAQKETIHLILEGFDIGAEVRMNEYPLSGIGLWSPWTEPSAAFGGRSFVFQVFNSFAKGSFGPDFDFLTQFDFADVDQVNEFAANFEPELFASTFHGEDFLPFRDEGGKVLYYHGAHDNVISGLDLPEYHDEVVAASGGERRAARWFRSFWVPGLSHCAAGAGPQDVPTVALDALATWVERGRAPEVLVGTRPDGRTFRICQFPQTSQFLGGVANPYRLNVNDAAHWECSGDGWLTILAAANKACPRGPGHLACVFDVLRRLR